MVLGDPPPEALQLQMQDRAGKMLIDRPSHANQPGDLAASDTRYLRNTSGNPRREGQRTEP